MGASTELLKVYVWHDELIMGKSLHEVIVDRVKELNRFGLAEVRIFSCPIDNRMSEFPQIVIKVLAGSTAIDQVQRFVKQLGSSGWTVRERVAALFC